MTSRYWPAAYPGARIGARRLGWPTLRTKTFPGARSLLWHNVAYTDAHGR